MEGHHIVGSDAAEARIDANGQVRMWMRAVNEPQEGLLGHRRGDVLQLAKAVEAQLTNAGEIAFLRSAG